MDHLFTGSWRSDEATDSKISFAPGLYTCTPSHRYDVLVEIFMLVHHSEGPSKKYTPSFSGAANSRINSFK